MTLYNPISIHRSGYLKVDSTHELYWEESGNTSGVPVVFLHGGPGGGSSPICRRFFNPQYYRIILFDQRGSGQSTPIGELKDNSTEHLVSDMEKLRKFLDISQWLIFGGSWGSTLGLTYGQAHPNRCLGFILRGVFLFSKTEVDWFLYGMKHFFPEAAENFKSLVQDDHGGDILELKFDILPQPLGANMRAAVHI
jgi:proline iminopeptidase